MTYYLPHRHHAMVYRPEALGKLTGALFSGYKGDPLAKARKQIKQALGQKQGGGGGGGGGGNTLMLVNIGIGVAALFAYRAFK